MRGCSYINCDDVLLKKVPSRKINPPGAVYKDGPRGRKGAIVTFSLLTALIMLCSTAQAATLEWEQMVHIDPPDDVDFNQTFNASASNATDWTNYNATILPFMNDTNISGTFTGSFLPPVVYELNTATSWGTYIGSVVRFKSEWVMSGSSVSWWRCPALNLTGWSVFYLRIWRLEAPGWLNVTWAGAGPNEASRPFKVFETWNSGATINDTWKGHNVEAWGENWTFIYNKVEAPIHSDTTYFAQWYIQGGDLSEEGGQHILMSQADIGDDGRLYTHAYDGSEKILEADLDISVIHQYGMGHTVSGYEVSASEGGEGGGGEPDIWGDPDDEDMITEAVHPSGTDHDGDWSGLLSGIAHLGVSSIYSQPSSGQFIRYQYDTAWDITAWETFTIWVRPWGAIQLVELRLLDTDMDGYWKQFVVASSAWNEIIVDLDDWDGWTTVGTPDLTIHEFLYIYNRDPQTDYLAVDHIYFETSGGGGGGGGNPSIVFYSNITDGPDSGSDYVTFFMPLMQDVNFTNAAVVRITEAGSGFDWNFVVDIQQDFILNSTVWPYPGTEGNQFLINVTLENKTNSFFIHDHNSAGKTDYDDTLSTHKNRFSLYNANDLVNGYQVYFRPYHALQVTNGSWVNEQLDPLYFYDGRFVNITDMKMLPQEHSPPVWYIVYLGLRMVSFQVYSILDKVVFNDLLPDLDVLIQQFNYEIAAVRNLINGAGEVLFIIGSFFKDMYEWILEYGPAILMFIVKGITLILGIPVFIAAVLVVNSVKRYFVIFAADGPEVGGEYAAHLVRNSFKKLPLPDIDRMTMMERKERKYNQKGRVHARKYGKSSPYHRDYSYTFSEKGQRQTTGMTHKKWKQMSAKKRWKNRRLD